MDARLSHKVCNMCTHSSIMCLCCILLVFVFNFIDATPPKNLILQIQHFSNACFKKTVCKRWTRFWCYIIGVAFLNMDYAMVFWQIWVFI